MPFPVSITGKIEIPRESMLAGDLELLKRRAVEILEMLTDSVTEEGMTVRSSPHLQDIFQGKVRNWHPMVAFDDIDLEITQSFYGTFVNYRFSTSFIFRFVTCFSAIFFLFGASGRTWIEGAKLAVLSFGWVFGMNYLLGWLRGPRWLRKQLLDPKVGSQSIN